MDVVLEAADAFFLNDLYPASWPADDPYRQFLSLMLIVVPGGALLYLLTASLVVLKIMDFKKVA